MKLEYIIATIIAVILGQVVSHLNKKLPPVVKEEITYKEFFSTLFKDFKIDVIYTIIYISAFNFLVYYLNFSYMSYTYMIVLFALTIVVSVDIRFQLIPDEVHIILILVGVFNFIININSWYMYILGAIAGGLVFWLLGLLSVLIFKKEGMGFGDVKLMAALGFIFGLKDILIIALVSFFVGAIVGGALLITKVKKMDSYIPFGPFIAIATIILMIVPSNSIIYVYISFCTWLGNVMTDFIYNIMN